MSSKGIVRFYDKGLYDSRQAYGVRLHVPIYSIYFGRLVFVLVCPFRLGLEFRALLFFSVLFGLFRPREKKHRERERERESL